MFDMFSNFVRNTDWGHVIGAIIAASGGLALWWRRRRDAWRDKARKRRAIRKAQAALPDTLGRFCVGLEGVTDAVDALQTCVRNNTLSIVRLTAYTTGAMDASSTPQCWFDDSGKMISCNEAMARLAGVGKADLLEYGYHMLMDSAHIRAFMVEHRYMSRHRRGREGRSRIVNAAGREVRIHFKISPTFKTADDTVKLFLCVLREEDRPDFDDSHWGALGEMT